MNLMSLGNEVLRASYRDPAIGRQLLVSGEMCEPRLPARMTSSGFPRGRPEASGP